MYTTTFCPRIKTEWTERSTALNCNKSNGYMCLPNDRFDELLEFCYREPVERIQKGKHFFLVFKVNANFSFVIFICPGINREQNIILYTYIYII